MTTCSLCGRNNHYYSFRSEQLDTVFFLAVTISARGSIRFWIASFKLQLLRDNRLVLINCLVAKLITRRLSGSKICLDRVFSASDQAYRYRAHARLLNGAWVRRRRMNGKEGTSAGDGITRQEGGECRQLLQHRLEVSEERVRVMFRS